MFSLLSFSSFCVCKCVCVHACYIGIKKLISNHVFFMAHALFFGFTGDF